MIEDAAEKQIKTIEDEPDKQTKSLKTLNTDQQLKSMGDLFPKNSLTAGGKEEL